MCIGGQFTVPQVIGRDRVRYSKVGPINKRRYSNHQKATTPLQLGIDMTRNSEAEKEPKVVKTTDVCGIEMFCVPLGIVWCGRVKLMAAKKGGCT